MPSLTVDIEQGFVVEAYRPLLVEACGEELYHLPPLLLVLAPYVLAAAGVNVVNGQPQALQGVGRQMLTTEVSQCQISRMKAMHRARRIGDRAHLIGVKFLPPVQRGGDVRRDRYHSQEFAVLCAALDQLLAQCAVRRADNNAAVGLEYAVASVPTVEGVAHTSQGGFPAVNLRALHIQDVKQY